MTEFSDADRAMVHAVVDMILDARDVVVDPDELDQRIALYLRADAHYVRDDFE